MSLSVHQLNADSTFLLTWSPTPPTSSTNKSTPSASNHVLRPAGSFTILVDPWLDGTTTIFHPKFALTNHTSPPIYHSLEALQDQLDLIIISQGMSDHCHKETLCTLPPDTTIPILAAPKAARMITSWNYFTNDIVRPLRPYSSTKPDTTFRIPITNPTTSSSQQEPGELTISNICPKLDLTCLHNAIGITYTPPSSATTLSVLYTPHGTPLPSILPYITSHLRPLPGALPLTALFHSLNTESNPWFLGGEVCAGAPAASELAREVGVRNWIGAHDEVKEVSGLGTKLIRSRVFDAEEARGLVGKEGCQVWVLGCGGWQTFT